ncbi:MAG: Asp-tRNA(Asn)/Glu-tRNA(Gln) amidotransferase subunit GatC [Bauldia sp.]
MAVDKETVKRVARLARIAVSEEEATALQGELSAILGFVAELDGADVSGVEPMTAVLPMGLRQRSDQVDDGECRDKILLNAPMADGASFLVPKVIE